MRQWQTDAEHIHELDPNLLFVNPKIESFLKFDEQFLVVASKGMGKTMLLRYKRNLVDQTKRGVIMVPQNSMCDYVALGGAYRQELVASMRNYSFWREMWEISIAVSVLLAFPHQLSDPEQISARADLERAGLPIPLQNELLASLSGLFHLDRTPSDVLSILLQQSKSDIEKSRKATLPVLHQLYLRYIRSSCYVFMDSFDQALEKLLPDDLEVWCAGQHGLLAAAWELSRHNRHVRVFAAIRQEAYASFSGVGLNIQGSVLLIEYSAQDLKELFLKAVRHYEALESIEDFIGVDQVYNSYVGIYENVFDYIYRHTIPIPRWLLTMGKELSGSRRERGLVLKKEQRGRREEVARIVNRVSSMTLATDYVCVEMKAFFQGADPLEFLNNLARAVASNVLSISHLRRVAKQLTDSPGYVGPQHPFCLMFNFGLLGYVDDDETTLKKRQIFRKPYEFDWHWDNILPISSDTHYLLHPCLFGYFERVNFRFKCSKVRIGQGLVWKYSHDAQVRKECLRLFISYAHIDWPLVQGLVESIEQQLSNKGIINDVWVDRWKMQGGKWVQDQLSTALLVSDFLILTVSKSSLGSTAVAVEWKTKFADKLKYGVDSVLPVIIDDTVIENLPNFLKQIYCHRYSDEDIVSKIVDDLVYLKQERERTVRPLRRR